VISEQNANKDKADILYVRI